MLPPLAADHYTVSHPALFTRDLTAGRLAITINATEFPAAALTTFTGRAQDTPYQKALGRAEGSQQYAPSLLSSLAPAVSAVGA